LNHIEIICRTTFARRWEQLLTAQLRAAGYGITTRFADAPESANDRGLDRALWLGRRISGPSLADRTTPLEATPGGPAALIIDLVGTAHDEHVPVLRLDYMGRPSLADGIADMVVSKQLPKLLARVDGTPVGQAAPMLDNRILIGRAANGLLAGAVSLIEQTVSAFFGGRMQPSSAPAALSSPAPDLLVAYLPHLVAGLAGRLQRKLTGKRTDHWQVAYRLIDGPGVAETGRLDGAPFTVLPDDGERFYADPFVIERDGKYFLFVEDYPYLSRKGVISVSETDENGRFGTPRVVIEEPHHLSYPQIIIEGDEIYMLPEGSGGSELVLYRAVAFPDRWVRDTVLLSGVEIADATLLIRDGRYWLVGTALLELGSSADTMVIYSAPALRGPWSPHQLNPIMIDRTAARPGGAMVERNGSVMLPVQDGSRGYGGGLGLAELIELSDCKAVWGPVRPIEPGSAWLRQGLHTLNRSGRMEVVDSTG
jgi:hypothetical protein